MTSPRAATAAIAALAVVALHPLFGGRLVDGHDAHEYPPRLVEFARVLADGHVPPVWAPDLGNGYGQPLFAFAPPLVYVAALPFHALGLGLARSLQLGLLVLHAVGASATYRIGRRLGGTRTAAVGGTAAWLFAPYLALDLFVRAAFAEAAALAVAPAALLALLRALDRPTAGRAAAAAVAIALVPLAHNAAALLLVPAFALIVLAQAVTAPRPSRVATLASGSGAIGLGLALSAYFWLPALVEKEFVHIDRLLKGGLRWSEHAVSPVQLLWSPWGYGLSVAGPDDGMSFAVGPVHLLLATLGVAVAVRESSGARRTLALVFAALSLAGAWLATTWSSALWSRIETLQYLAFPWRTLLLPALFLPLLATFALDRAGRWAWLPIAVLVAVNLPHARAQGVLAFDDEDYAPASIASRGVTTTTREEYEPRGVERRPPYRAARVVGLGGALAVTPVSRRAAREEVLVGSPFRMPAEWTTFYYPGWTLTIDGVPAAIGPLPVTGTIGFELPPGDHRLVLELTPTPVRNAGMLVTLLAALVVAGVGGGTIAREYRTGRRRSPG